MTAYFVVMIVKIEVTSLEITLLSKVVSRHFLSHCVITVHFTVVIRISPVRTGESKKGLTLLKHFQKGYKAVLSWHNLTFPDPKLNLYCTVQIYLACFY